MNKKADTRRKILRVALDLSSELGLEGLTIGLLAKAVGMSKSGLYAHFDSKENLQCAVMDAAAEHFVDAVISPALKKPRGIPRLEALFEHWLEWEVTGLSGGCPFVAASVEFDDRPGPVRTQLIAHVNDMLGAVARAAQIAVEEGQFRESLDIHQFAHDYWAIVLGHHHFARLMGDEQSRPMAQNSFKRLVRDAIG